MKKILLIILTLVLVWSLSFNVFANEKRFEKSEDFIEKYNKSNQSYITMIKQIENAKETSDYDEYGGAYIDDDGFLIVMLVNDSEKEKSKYKKISGNENIKFKKVSYSLKKLKKEKNKLRENLQKWTDEGLPISGLSLNEKENKVVIYLAKKSSKAKEEIFSIIDSDMVEIQYEDYAKTLSRTNSHNPTIGGIRTVNLDNNKQYSIGFLAKEDNGNVGFVTCGHNMSVGDEMTNGGTASYYKYGEVDTAVFNTSGDYAFVDRSSNYASIGKLYDDYNIQGSLTFLSVGSYVLTHGYSSGTNIGQVLEKDYDVYYSEQGVWCFNMIKSSNSVNVGDSGGCVTDVEWTGTNVYVLGVISGKGSNYAIFQPYEDLTEYTPLEYDELE